MDCNCKETKDDELVNKKIQVQNENRAIQGGRMSVFPTSFAAPIVFSGASLLAHLLAMMSGLFRGNKDLRASKWMQELLINQRNKKRSNMDR